MHGINVKCDPAAQEFCSTRIIVNATNQALKNLGLYDENGKTVVYDCLSNDHRFKTEHLWCAYELTLHPHIISNLKYRNCIALSRGGSLLFTRSNYPKELVNFCGLGVDTDIWKPVTKKYNKEKFVFLSAQESNSRSSYELLVSTFAATFSGQKGVQLYIKDRNATSIFKDFVKGQATTYNVDIVLDDRHITNFEDQRLLLEGADVNVNLAHAHTWGLNVSQAMACGVPTILMRYCGFSDYCDDLNSIPVNFSVVDVTQEYIQKCVEIVGLKNFLFPIDQHVVKPFWAHPDLNHLSQVLQNVVENRSYLDTIRQGAIQTAQNLTWERAALNLCYIVNK